MREHDVLLCAADKGPQTDDGGAGFLMRRVVGRVLLAMSVLVIAAGFPGFHASAASGADRTAGAELYKQNGCEHCHGADGIGTEQGPALTTVGKRLHKEQIEHQIRDGGKQMPPFQDVLNDDQVRELVDYLAHKKKAPKAQHGS